MRSLALVVLALACAPTLLLAQGEPATGGAIATVRSESGSPLAEAEVRTGERHALTDALDWRGSPFRPPPRQRPRIGVVTAKVDPLVNVDSPPSRNDYPVSTGVRAYSGESTMCPNCLTSIATALGGAGSAVLLSLCSRQALAAAGIRFRTGRTTDQSITEETT